jgi:hypothetical protein
MITKTATRGSKVQLLARLLEVSSTTQRCHYTVPLETLGIAYAFIFCIYNFFSGKENSIILAIFNYYQQVAPKSLTVDNRYSVIASKSRA